MENKPKKSRFTKLYRGETNQRFSIARRHSATIEYLYASYQCVVDHEQGNKDDLGCAGCGYVYCQGQGCRKANVPHIKDVYKRYKDGKWTLKWEFEVAKKRALPSCVESVPVPYPF